MKEVFKVCLGTAPQGMFLSVLKHAWHCSYHLNTCTVPLRGCLYAFANEEAAINWLADHIEADHRTVVVKRLLQNKFNVYLLRGTSSRVVSRYYQTMRHLPLVQLRQRVLFEEFWGERTTRRSRTLEERPEPPGSILVPDFTPTAIVSTINAG